MGVEVEHHYYGESWPTEDQSTKNMRYLMSDQALEDFATFRIQWGAQQNLVQNKWILFGCSYAGAMSTWARLKYPHLFYAALGGSSPLLAEADFYQYDQTVAYSLNLQSPECLQRAQQGTKDVQNMLENGQVADVEQLFDTCSPITNYANFMEDVYNPIAFSVQYNESPN